MPRSSDDLDRVLAAVPDFRGRFTPAPARAYPYYAPDRTSLGPGPAIEVR